MALVEDARAALLPTNVACARVFASLGSAEPDGVSSVAEMTDREDFSAQCAVEERYDARGL
jgi:hypothetical protein